MFSTQTMNVFIEIVVHFSVMYVPGLALGQKALTQDDLLSRLQNRDAVVRFETLDSLSQKQAILMLPTITQMLNDPSESVRLAVLRVLARLGPAATPAIPDLIRVHKNQDAGRISLAAQHILGELGPLAHDAIPALIEPLTKKDEYGGTARERTPLILEKVGPHDRRVLEALKLGLSDEIEIIRVHSATVLLKNMKYMDIAMKALDSCLLSPDARVRIETIKSLVIFRPKDVYKKIRAICYLKNIEVRQVALAAMVDLDSSSDDVVQIFIDILRESENSLTETAAYQLGRMGKFASKAIHPLEVAAAESNTSNGARIEIAYALWRIDDKKVEVSLKYLIAALADEDNLVRMSSLNRLASIGPAASRAVQNLQKIVQSDLSQDVKDAAAIALKRIGR